MPLKVKERFAGFQYFSLISGGLEGRQKAFDLIWEAYYRRIYYFASNIVNEDAEDVLQDIMVKVYKNLDKYNPYYAFSTWIFTVARNHCINFLKKRRPLNRSWPEAGTESEGQSSPTPEDEMVFNETVRRIDEYLDELDPAYRQMAYLRFFEGMKTVEIARILGIPVGSVKSRIHLIRKGLKKVLEIDDAR